MERIKIVICLVQSSRILTKLKRRNNNIFPTDNGVRFLDELTGGVVSVHSLPCFLLVVAVGVTYKVVEALAGCNSTFKA